MSCSDCRDAMVSDRLELDRGDTPANSASPPNCEARVLRLPVSPPLSSRETTDKTVVASYLFGTAQEIAAAIATLNEVTETRIQRERWREWRISCKDISRSSFELLIKLFATHGVSVSLAGGGVRAK